ncbi:MAG: DinB family protein [Armatimonadota bacterium]
MNFARVYEVLTQARQKLFDWVRPLSQEQYTRQFPFGKNTVRSTLTEIAVVEWLYGRRLQQPRTAVLPRDQWPISEQRQPTFRDLEPVWTEQAQRTRALLAGITDWDAVIEYRRAPHPGKVIVVKATRSDVATQMCMHEVHHRAQVMAMLRQFGVAAQDLDYGAFAFHESEESA